jgi:hypothetical protein
MFRETKNKKIRFVSVFRTTTETNRTGLKQTITNKNNPKFSKKYQNMLSIKLFQLVFCLFQFNLYIKTLYFGIEEKQPKQTVSKQTKTNRKNPKFSAKNTEISPLSKCFRCSFVCFGSIKTPKLSVSV